MATQRTGAWDAQQRAEALKIIEAAANQTRDYLTYAIEYSHRDHIKPAEFWRNLFVPYNAKGDKLMWKREGCSPDNVPQKPYYRLDIQLVCKYLRNGWQSSGLSNEDSKYFFQKFIANKGDRDRYRISLCRAIELRNQYLGHLSKASEDEMDRNVLNDFIDTYKSLTECLRKNRKWYPDDTVKRVDEYWKDLGNR